MVTIVRGVLFVTAVAATTGCGVTPPRGTGGTDVPSGPCGRGLIVAESDYQSANFSLVGYDGAELSSSFLSSASGAPGVMAAFSGDAVLPTMPASGDRLVIVDRSFASLTWAEVATSAVRARLSVSQGFPSNPQDYAQVGAHKAYVSRLDPNLAPGAEPFDGGSDVIVIDPATPAIIGRIDLAPAMAGEDPKFHPRPNRIVVDGDRAVVLLSAYDLSFTASAPSRLVVLDTTTDAIVSTKVLDGLHGCAGLGLSPEGGRIAVACSGTFENDMTADISQAGLAVLARSGDTLEEQARFAAATFGQGPLGFSVDFADASTVLFTTFGEDPASGAPARDDTAIALDLSSGEHTVVLRSQGMPFTLGEVRCAAKCGACFVADAGTGGGVLQRLSVQGGVVTPDRGIRVGAEIGLPPRYVGRF